MALFRVSLLVMGCIIAGCDAQDLEIIEGPRDDVIMAGDDTTLTCRVEGDLDSDIVEWKEFISTSSGKRIWFSNQSPEDISDPDKYEILNQFDLKVKNASVQDGGQYGCQLMLSDDPYFRSADLYVFEPAVCESRGEELHEGDVGVVVCTVPFGGTSPPQVDFFKDGRLIEKESYVTDTFLVIWANITVTAEDDDRDYECRVHLADPSYSDSCRASLQVYYFARNLSIEPFSDSYVIGNQLECTARGNPEPEVRWTQVIPGNDVINGSTLTLTSGMVDAEQTWTCTAENTVQGNMTWVEMNITFNVLAESPSAGNRFALNLANAISVFFVIMYIVTP